MTITMSPRILRLTVVVLLIATGVVAGMAVSAAMAGAAVEDVSYTAVSPCAVFDSRFGTGPFDGPYRGSVVGGAFSPGNMKTLRVTGSGLTTNGGETQGANDDCAIPLGASAVHINIVAIGAQTVGNVVVVDSGGTPSGGIVTYQVLSPGLNNSNAHTVPLSASGELDIYANCGNNCIIDTVEVRGIVLGYYTNGLADRVAALETLLADVTRVGNDVTFPGDVEALQDLIATNNVDGRTVTGGISVSAINLFASGKVQAGRSVFAGENVYAHNNVTAVNDVIAENDVTADRDVIADRDVTAVRDVIADDDVIAGNDVIADLLNSGGCFKQQGSCI